MLTFLKYLNIKKLNEALGDPENVGKTLKRRGQMSSNPSKVPGTQEHFMRHYEAFHSHHDEADDPDIDEYDSDRHVESAEYHFEILKKHYFDHPKLKNQQSADLESETSEAGHEYKNIDHRTAAGKKIYDKWKKAIDTDGHYKI